ncbi:MAG: hypothetical protein ACOYN1_06010 [Polynucleobacter sp.]
MRLFIISVLLLAILPNITLAQKAGSGADQIETFAEPIAGLPTEGSIWGMPVNLHGQTTYINQRYNNFTYKEQ